MLYFKSAVLLLLLISVSGCVVQYCSWNKVTETGIPVTSENIAIQIFNTVSNVTNSQGVQALDIQNLPDWQTIKNPDGSPHVIETVYSLGDLMVDSRGVLYLHVCIKKEIKPEEFLNISK